MTRLILTTIVVLSACTGPVAAPTPTPAAPTPAPTPPAVASTPAPEPAAPATTSATPEPAPEPTAPATASATPEPAPTGADPSLPRSDDHLRDRCDRPPPPSRRPGAEKVSYGRYFVTNQSPATIRISGTNDGEAVAFKVSKIAPGKTAAIHEVWEGSGGHVRPSNFLDTFEVKDATGTLYSGVENLDWIDRGSHCGHERYELVVGPRKQ